MFLNMNYPAEIILKPDAKRFLPNGMSAAERIYLVEAMRPGQNFLRICTNPDGRGLHTTIRPNDVNLKATAALI